MPHVSFNKLEDKERKELYQAFIRALGKAFASAKGSAVMYEFLTYTEREMFAKRLAVIALIKKEIPVSKIVTTLKMSRVTIDTMAVKYEAGKYAQIVSTALKEKSVGDVIDAVIQNMDTAGGLMPPYIGRGRKNH